MSMNQTYTLAKAATKVGVSAITLKRWLLAGKVAEVRRDRNGWRVFHERDIRRIRKYAETLTQPVTR